MTNPLDEVTLVNEFDEVLGSMDKIDAHRGGAQRPRAISVFLWNSHGQILMQRRSAQKIVGAGLWANTCCGNVRPTEDYLGCALRRLREELSISYSGTLMPLDKFEYSVRCNNEFSEWEIDQIFWGEYDGSVLPIPSEVQEYAWQEVKFVERQILERESFFVPWLPILLRQPQLQKKWRSYADTR